MAIHLEQLTLLVLQLNKAIDSGQHDDISIADVRARIERGGVIEWLKRRIKHFDASPWIHDQHSMTLYDQKLSRIYNAYAGKERGKWGVENKGLCLLLAWTNELIQQRDDIDFSKMR